jgi:hypothetical protein
MARYKMTRNRFMALAAAVDCYEVELSDDWDLNRQETEDLLIAWQIIQSKWSQFTVESGEQS